MLDKLQQILQEAKAKINSARTPQDLKAAQVEFLGRKSFLANAAQNIGRLPAEQRPLAGKTLNSVKKEITALLEEKQKSLQSQEQGIDISLPASPLEPAGKHPLINVINEICGVFEDLGFEIQEGTEVETEWYNFQALNIPLEHPSRDMFDTFYLNLSADKNKGKYLLRSHTSPSQIRIMEKRKPPLAVVVPGKVYRPDNVDASHSFMFHQIEGFAVGENINFSHLKGVLIEFARQAFSPETKLRFRPHFFPFTEPSAEVDISCLLCQGKGCSVCKQSGWLEILGCGMIHPNVLKAVNINPNKYQGFAFGMGVERIAMLKYGIDDIRLFFSNHKKFLGQFYEV